MYYNIIIYNNICSVNEVTPMEHIYILFEMVRVGDVYVVSKNDGTLKGMIARQRLLEQLTTGVNS